MKKHPEYTFCVLRELQRRDGLRTAIAGRDEKNLLPLLQFLHKNIADARFSGFLTEVVGLTLDLYSLKMGGSWPKADRLFVDIKKRVDRESRTLRQMMMLKGSLDLVLSAKDHKKPTLTCQEQRLKESVDENSLVFQLLNR